MSDFCFIHAADIHLDSPMKGLSRYGEAPAEQLRGATRAALKNLVALAKSTGAKFVVIAGDLYDGTWRDMRTGHFAFQQFGELAKAGIDVFIVYGNHDADSKITKGLTPPKGVHIFGSKECETATIPDLKVAIHGQSFAIAQTKDNLAAGYCPPTPGMLNIAVLHTALEGGHAHANYAPCKLAELAAKKHDYWALGHVHDFGTKREDPYVIYPGNLQGRSVRETGAKGAVVVHVENGRIARAEHHPLDEVRWSVLSIDTTSIRERREFIEAVDSAVLDAAKQADGRLLVARVGLKLAGAMAGDLLRDRLHIEAEIRGAATRTGVDCWIEKVLFTRQQAIAYELPPVLEELLASAHQDSECLEAVATEVQGVIGQLPNELLDSETAPLLTALSKGDLAAVVAESRALLAVKLQGEAA